MTDYEYADTIKRIITENIDKLCDVKWMFLRNPLKDFTRNRKITFKDFINFLLQEEGSSAQNDLMKFFKFAEEYPTKSALCQQRAKVSPDALESLFTSFTRDILNVETPHLLKGYRVLAVDGSDINIPYNPDDTESFQQNGNKKGFNQLHLNALCDVLNGIYVDAILNTDNKIHERAAFLTMLDRVPLNVKDPMLFLADMGYEGYNVLAHLIESGQKFLFRIKDDSSNGIISTWDFSEDRLPNGEFDCILSPTLTWKQTNEVKSNRDVYRYVPKTSFDFYKDDNPYYKMTLRIVCVEVEPGCFTYMATNLDSKEFSPDELKEIYHKRWSEEISFRQLKYALDLLSFHSRKRAYVEQEIWAKLVVFNFCETIVRHTAIPEQGSLGRRRKYDQKINFSTAACILLEYLKPDTCITRPCKLIKRNLVSIRPGRKFPRKLKTQSARIFLYRAS